jgi:N6-adenosine-specific RNA methylase IME4/ParB-like chromosome segregation protein Spo0J
MAKQGSPLPPRLPGPVGVIELRPTGSLRPHPEAGRLPEMDAKVYREWRADIERRGLLTPLEINAAGVVLDGHLRLRAAGELGLKEVPVRVIAPADEVEYLVHAALQHRYLSPWQRATLAVELDLYRDAQAAGKKRSLANLKGQTEVAKLPPRGKTRDLAAAVAGVSARTIQDASRGRAADPVLFEEVKQGRLPLQVAARRIQQRERDAALPPPPPLPTEPHEVIYGDPPWRLAGSPDSSRAVENHYQTMPLAEIAAMRIPAADNAVLFLWAVNSLLPEALEVMAAWGFVYENNFAWFKDRIGLGSWNRNQHELLLVGSRGTFKAPAANRRFSSVIQAARRVHSRKPEKTYQMIEKMYPAASKLELFARGKARPGWTAWGNEAEPADQAGE